MNVIGSVGNTVECAKCVRHVENAISIRFIEHIMNRIRYFKDSFSHTHSHSLTHIPVRNLNHRCERVTLHVPFVVNAIVSSVWMCARERKEEEKNTFILLQCSQTQKHVWFHTSYHFGFHLIMSRICSFEYKVSTSRAMCKSTFEEC